LLSKFLPNGYLPSLGAGSIVRYLCLNLAGMMDWSESLVLSNG
jgi:hypothetical protein